MIWMNKEIYKCMDGWMDGWMDPYIKEASVGISLSLGNITTRSSTKSIIMFERRRDLLLTLVW